MGFGGWDLCSLCRYAISHKRTFFFFLLLQLYKPYAPRPHNKANLCCTTLQVAGCEPHMSGRNPFYLLKIFLLTAEEGRVE